MTQNAQKGQKNDQKSALFNRREQKVYSVQGRPDSGNQEVDIRGTLFNDY